MTNKITRKATRPFDGQRPGTSGLRKKTQVFQQENYAENFVQATFNALQEQGKRDFFAEKLVVGGDGRFFNDTVVEKIVRIAAGNGVGEVLIAQNGILSTPAASAVIRKERALGGFVLSASHNPGGENADFGMKYNAANGGPAPESLTEQIYEQTTRIDDYAWYEGGAVRFSELDEYTLGETKVTVFDPLQTYCDLMEELFDFEALRRLLQSDFQFRFDAMHAVTGPFAKEIFEVRLGAPEGTVVRGEPKEDFGGLHPDPNLVHAHELVQALLIDGDFDFGAASDGDGDRNLILGKQQFVSPGDSLAVIAYFAQIAIPGYRDGLQGVARSMPTSMAVDVVAKKMGIPRYETPTGWKYFGNLMDAGRCTLCGEESFGTGSNHVREKDGLWAVLCWLSILAYTGKSVKDVMSGHWQQFGRNYFQRHDFEELDSETAAALIRDTREKLPSLKGRTIAGEKIVRADDFEYQDPVDGSVASGKGIRIFLEKDARIVCRLSGTGTSGATLRVYLERWLDDDGKGDVDTILAPLRNVALELFELKDRFDRTVATVVT